MLGSKELLALVFTFIFSARIAQAQETLSEEQKEKMRQDIIDARVAAENELKNNPMTLDELQAKGLVEVEPSNVLPPDLVTKDPLVPYRVRRKDSGNELIIIYSQFNPSNYASDLASPGFGDFETLFGDAETPLIEIAITKKLNMKLGSLGGEFAFGMYQNEVDDTSFGDITLSLQVLRLGGRFVLNSFMNEPTIAPYFGAGAYAVFYKEELSSTSFNGSTQAAPYFYGGALFQLNWIDRQAAAESYINANIENTFVFVEARKFIASTVSQDPDFETDIDLNFGLNVEF